MIRVLIIVHNLPVLFDRRVWLERQAPVSDGYQVAVVCPEGDLSYEVVQSLICTGMELMKLAEAKMSTVGKARARPDQAREVLDAVTQRSAVATYKKVMSQLDWPGEAVAGRIQLNWYSQGLGRRTSATTPPGGGPCQLGASLTTRLEFLDADKWPASTACRQVVS